jgi:hypothetical protein
LSLFVPFSYKSATLLPFLVPNQSAQVAVRSVEVLRKWRKEKKKTTSFPLKLESLNVLFIALAF